MIRRETIVRYYTENTIAKLPYSLFVPLSFRRKERSRLIVSVLIILFLFVSCGKKSVGFTPEERRAADSIVSTVHSVDSLALLQKRLEAEGNRLGSIAALREWGKALRNESRFDESLRVHGEGLKQAESLGDTLEWVQALNYIGTDYRRLGVLDAAQEYHYRALKLCEACTDTSFTAKKNRVKSLNGLGNIYLTLGNYERADSAFRLALAGERALGSAVGQAINYANLGSIFKHRRQNDSAWVYYRRSMELNQKAGNDIGIALCHTYYGLLYEEAQQYDKAYAEYRTAYGLMEVSKDEWHALESLIALAHIDYVTGNETRALDNLHQAEATARKIKSKEHLADIYALYYRIYEKQGDYRRALANHVQASALQDSVAGAEKMNRIQNVSLNIEHWQQAERMSQARQELESERTAKLGILYTGILLVLLLLLTVAFLFYSGRMKRRNHLLLKKMSTLCENFFTNITHEFRTPISVILGLSRDIAQDTETPESVRKRAFTIERQGNSLLTLINQLLDISKVKSAVGNPDLRCGDIAVQVGMIVESYRDYAHSRGIDLQFISKGDTVMDFVPDYVNKVLNNLISNALKFTPQYGKVSLSVWREGERVQLDIADTGKGIPAESLTHVFEPFYQAESEAAHLGTGVGLALVKQIVDAVGGTIEIESTLGKGTTFHLSIPVRHGKNIHAAVGTEEAVNTPLLPECPVTPNDSEAEDNDSQRLLIIEDNSDVAAYIGLQLADRYAIYYASDGRGGLEKAKELVPDLIITDLMMPGMDGLEVCRRVRGNEIINHVPIIIVTAKISEEDRVRGLEAGADAYLTKPFSSQELRMRVEKLVEQRRLLREKYSQGTENKEENTLQDVADRRFLLAVTDHIYLLLNAGKNVDVTQIASKMCMSNSQFYRKMTALTGYTPTTFIQYIKIRKARQLLDKNPQMNFKEVSELSGFSDYSTFVRAFKNICGVKPTEYVKETE